MRSRKRLNSDGSTRKIIVEKDNGSFGSFASFTPREAAEYSCDEDIYICKPDGKLILRGRCDDQPNNPI